MRGLSHSKSSLKRSTRSCPILKTNSRSRASPRPSDACMAKRVKFSDSTRICEPEAVRDGPLPQNKGAHLSCSDDAKTSELKSFKRLLEKTSHMHFDKVTKSDIKLKEGKARDCIEATSNAIQGKSDVRRSSPVQNVSFIVQNFLSSPTQVSKKKEIKDKAIGNNGSDKSVALSKISPVDCLLHPSSGEIFGGGHSGPLRERKASFLEKRSCLLQLAAGTCLQSIDSFLCNRSAFILEILQRLRIGKNANRLEKPQNLDQERSAHQFPASSKRSNQIVKLRHNSQESSSTHKTEQYDNLLALKCDNIEFQAFPSNHYFKTSSNSKQWTSNLFSEKTPTLLPDFDDTPSAIDMIKECYYNKYIYSDKPHTLLSSPCNISEVNVVSTDFTTYMEQIYKNLHFNSTLDNEGLHDLCVTKDSDSALNLKLEVDYSSHGSHRRNYDTFQIDCIFPNSYNSESFFQEQALNRYLHPEIAKEQLSLPLLEWDGNAEQELPAPTCLSPEEVDHFTNPCMKFSQRISKFEFL